MHVEAKIKLGGNTLKKEELIRKSFDNNLKSKAEILESILTVVRAEENVENTKDDLNILILLLVQRKDMCGYEIVKEMEIKSKKNFSMKEGAIYPILHFLEHEGFIASYWKEENHINIKYYRLIENGREYLRVKTAEIEKFRFLDIDMKLQKIN